MELTVGKADLQKELQLCQGVVEKRSTIPILSNVLLRAADGRLQIAATDLDVTILSSTSARITTPGGVTIEAKRLFDIVRSLPDEDVHFTLQENNSVLVESGTAKFRLPLEFCSVARMFFSLACSDTTIEIVATTEKRHTIGYNGSRSNGRCGKRGRAEAVTVAPRSKRLMIAAAPVSRSGRTHPSRNSSDDSRASRSVPAGTTASRRGHPSTGRRTS